MRRWTEIESSGAELRRTYNDLARGEDVPPRDIEELAVFLDHVVEFLGQGVERSELEERLDECEAILRERMMLLEGR